MVCFLISSLCHFNVFLRIEQSGFVSTPNNESRIFYPFDGVYPEQ
jgi:hypothetical protein